jgi:hypothetical protein
VKIPKNHEAHVAKLEAAVARHRRRLDAATTALTKYLNSCTIRAAKLTAKAMKNAAAAEAIVNVLPDEVTATANAGSSANEPVMEPDGIQ